ncbi:MFS transporter [Ignatzschineria rhizosphaerae]|uniref:MFS transporter n=1 Tax=Ignatzschineria rhizosphaerae TaxID=2923279 RepID=A0ABY3X1Z9_9GAMM|nr:MFS transporter [Ignatzschineria rhizosphaerae]UNM96897.1 MFS transporter [Ignatzschineria rhizosphaerae]
MASQTVSESASLKATSQTSISDLDPVSGVNRWDWFLLLSLGNFKIILVGFYMLSIVTILKQSGFTLNQLSIFYLLGFTELTQLVISSVIQRYQVNHQRGHFRFWLLLSNIIIFLALFALFWIDITTQFGLLMLCCFVLSIMGNFLAGATLGLNSTILSYRERGMGGVISVISARSGRMIGGGLVLYLYQYWGWHVAVGLMLAISILINIQLFFYREPKIRGVQSQVCSNTAMITWKMMGKRLITYWQEEGTGWKWFLLLLLSCIPYALTATTFIPVLSDQGWDMAEVGTILAIYLPVLCMIAGPISGILMRYYSRFTVIFGILAILSLVFISFIFTEKLRAFYSNIFIVQIMVLSIGYTLLLPAVMAIFMDKASKEMATLDSSLQYTIMIGGAAIAGFFSLRIANSFGFATVYGVATAISLFTVFFLAISCRQLFQREVV